MPCIGGGGEAAPRAGEGQGYPLCGGGLGSSRPLDQGIFRFWGILFVYQVVALLFVKIKTVPGIRYNNRAHEKMNPTRRQTSPGSRFPEQGWISVSVCPLESTVNAP